MARTPTVVGINRTQDGSIAVATPHSMHTLQKERVSRRKHHWGRLGDLPRLYLECFPELRGPVDLVVEGWSSDSEVEHADDYHDELRACLDLTEDARILTVSHHLSHLYSAFPPSPFRAAAGMVIDAQGSRVRDLTEPAPTTVPLASGAPGDLLEVGTFYRCRREPGRLPVEVLAKQLWDGDWARPVGLGCFYSLLTKMLWPEGEGNEGKVMGLAPFGDPARHALPALEVRGHEVFIPGEWLKAFDEKDRYCYFIDGSGEFQDCADLAAAGQLAFEEAILAVSSWLHETSGMDDLVFAGGIALNCSANGRILRESAFRDVFIPPSPHDGGTAVGCALYGLIECLGRQSEFRWHHDFLGPERDVSEVRAAVAALRDDVTVTELADDDELVGAVVDQLLEGHVVAVHDGPSESGPRALGHRTILGDPRRPAMQDYINFEVKGREWFRPLAPLVLADHADEIFDVDRPAPFMQYAADVRPQHRATYPGITHVDGTARLQTVEPENTPFLHRLLTAWYERTGCPVLINTSLNGPGDPLTETPEQSLATLRSTGMHALAMPPFLVTKDRLPPVPDQSWERPDVPARSA
jgi:carbamoyltransferase